MLAYIVLQELRWAEGNKPKIIFPQTVYIPDLKLKIISSPEPIAMFYEEKEFRLVKWHAQSAIGIDAKCSEIDLPEHSISGLQNYLEKKSSQRFVA